MLKRRDVLASIGVGTALLTGCLGGEENNDGIESENATTEPEETPTKYGLPSCDSGEFVFQILNTDTKGGILYITVENMQSTPIEISTIKVTIDPEDDAGCQDSCPPKTMNEVIGTGGTGGDEHFEGGERGSIFVEFTAFEDGIYLDAEDFTEERIEDISLTPVHYDRDEYDGTTCS